MTTAQTPEPQLTTQFTMPSDREIVATRTFDAPRELVWRAHVEPEHVRHWLLGPDGWSMPVCEIDLRPGGAWRYTWRNDKTGHEFSMFGTYKEVDPPHRVVHTETMDPGMPETLNTMVLTEENGRTTLTVTVLYASKEAREAALATGMLGGWSQSYDRLEQHIATVR